MVTISRESTVYTAAAMAPVSRSQVRHADTRTTNDRARSWCTPMATSALSNKMPIGAREPVRNDETANTTPPRHHVSARGGTKHKPTKYMKIAVKEIGFRGNP